MLYNIIGDIHGRDAWRQLVREDAVNIFLGDYFDPYHYDDINPGEQELANLLDIIEFKQQHPETILLLGNHEYHYLSDERYSRYNDLYADRFAESLRQHWHLFQVAYAIGKRILVSHAGVTQPWCQLAGIGDGLSTHDLMQVINDRMNKEATRSLFGVERSFDPWDSYGLSATASPLWVRDQADEASTTHITSLLNELVSESELSERERMVLEAKYGVGDYEEAWSTEELATELDMTTQSVNRICRRALDKIRIVG